MIRKLAIAIVVGLVAFIVLIFSAYLFLELTWKSRRQAESLLEGMERERHRSAANALTIDQAIDGLRDASYDDWEYLLTRINGSSELWRPMYEPGTASPADRQRLVRAVTALGEARYSHPQEIIARVPRADPAIRTELLTALITGLARREGLRKTEVGRQLFEQGGLPFFSAAVGPLTLSRGDQLAIAQSWTEQKSDEEALRHLAAWKKAGLPMPPATPAPAHGDKAPSEAKP